MNFNYLQSGEEDATQNRIEEESDSPQDEQTKTSSSKTGIFELVSRINLLAF